MTLSFRIYIVFLITKIVCPAQAFNVDESRLDREPHLSKTILTCTWLYWKYLTFIVNVLAEYVLIL